jgi:hypothetical protein
MSVIADESGQTLPELMIATVIGLIVVFAAFLLMTTALAQNNRISQREDASQRGRQAMELITRELRSQICVTEQTPAISVGQNNVITFTDDLSGNNRPPVQRTLTFDPVAKTIVEKQYQGIGFPPATTFPTTPTQTVTLLQNVVAVPSGTPVFQYYPFDFSGAPGLNPTPLATPLIPQDATLAVDVRVTFLVRGNNSPSDAYGSTFQNDVYTRVADPTTPALGTNCS